MKLKTKLIAVPTAIVAVGVVGATATVLQNKDPDIVLVANFDTLVGKPVVTVQLTDTVPIAWEVKTLVWERVMKVAPGLRVTLSVMQQGGRGASCAILRDGALMDTRPLHGPGTISCQHVVTP